MTLKTIIILTLIGGCFLWVGQLFAANPMLAAPPDSTLNNPGGIDWSTPVEIYLFPFLSFLAFCIWKIPQARALRVLHFVWDIIVSADQLFDEKGNITASEYLNRTNKSLNLAKKVYVCDALGSAPPKWQKSIIKYFKTFEGGVEGAFKFFKLGKSIREVLR